MIRGEWGSLQARAEELLAVAAEQGLAFWLPLGTFDQGWALVGQGQYAEGISRMRQGITGLRATGSQLGQSGLLRTLAEADSGAENCTELVRNGQDSLAYPLPKEMLMDIWDMIADQRHQLVAILQNLDEGQWHTPSLCTGWTVRDVVGHLITPFELGMGKMFLRLIGNGFNIDKTLMQAAQQLARRPTSELVSVLRANAQTRWTPPGIGPEAPLTDILIHTLDICHPLHIPHTIEPERLRHTLNFLVSRKSRVFTKPDRIAGLRLVPDDLEWSWGDGLEVRGKAQNVMMVLGGRTAMLDALTGPGVPQLQARLLSSKSS